MQGMWIWHIPTRDKYKILGALLKLLLFKKFQERMKEVVQIVKCQSFFWVYSAQQTKHYSSLNICLSNIEPDKPSHYRKPQLTV